MNDEKTCECGAGPRLIFACSGATDVGEIADRAARKMAEDGLGKMFCTVGIGGRISGIMKTAKVASEILAVDGCALGCVKESLEQAGLKNFKHLQLADIGMEKFHSPVTDERIAQVVREGKKLFNS